MVGYACCSTCRRREFTVTFDCVGDERGWMVTYDGGRPHIGSFTGAEPGTKILVQVMGPADGAFLVRAPNHDVLCSALAAVPRPGGRLRVAVDPLRL